MTHSDSVEIGEVTIPTQSWMNSLQNLFIPGQLLLEATNGVEVVDPLELELGLQVFDLALERFVLVLLFLNHLLRRLQLVVNVVVNVQHDLLPLHVR